MNEPTQPAWMSAPIVQLKHIQPLMYRAPSQDHWRSVASLPLLAQLLVLDSGFDATAADTDVTVLEALERAALITELALVKAAFESKE